MNERYVNALPTLRLGTKDGSCYSCCYCYYGLVAAFIYTFEAALAANAAVLVDFLVADHNVAKQLWWFSLQFL